MPDLLPSPVYTPDRYVRHLWKAPGYGSQHPHGHTHQASKQGDVIKVLHRAKLKSPGHQKVNIPKKGGFTKFNKKEFEDMVYLIPDGYGIKYIPNCGSSDK